MIIQSISQLPNDFLILEAESKIEGFKFLEKMRCDWDSGKNQFDKSGEALFGIFEEENLVAIGGINLDPYTNEQSIGRLRHLYVLRNYREKGLGALLVNKIIEHGSKHFSKIRLRTDTYAASKFYENLGFNGVDDDFASHEWKF